VCGALMKQLKAKQREEEKRAERDGAKENKENVEQDVEEKLRENKINKFIFTHDIKIEY
jgi:hypothetical protein